MNSSNPVPWHDKERPSVILLGSGDRDNVPEEVERMRPIITKHADIVIEDFTFTKDLSQVDADMAVVLGGDGSILRAAKQMAMNQVPAVGVNLGKLGFLADLQPNEFASCFLQVVNGECAIVEHLMFRCEIIRGGDVTASFLGLNETAVLGGPPFSMLNVELYVDADLATTYSCDGLIISTPVGSTAHSLSAGGPILRKNLQAFVISPISPHTLTVRPVVDMADRVFEMVVRKPNEGTAVVVDGQVVHQVKGDERIRVRRAESTFSMIQVPGRNYYRTLRKKLGWSGDIRRRRQS
ncbi:MAG: NAD+ kinase [Pirellulaceae bacterium]|jgi:NAD+ kinase